MKYPALIATLLLSACATSPSVVPAPVPVTVPAPAPRTPLALRPITAPTTATPQTFEVQVAGETWTLTHSSQRATALHVPSGRKADVWWAEDADEYLEYDFSARLVSLVGPHLTYEVLEGGYAEGTAHPFANHRFVTVELSIQAMDHMEYGNLPGVSLAWAFYETHDCLTALREQPVSPELWERCKGPEPAAPILEAVAPDPWLMARRAEDRGCAYSEDDLTGTSYGFQSIDGDQITVVLGLGHGCEAARGAFKELAFSLPIPESLSEPLQRAAGDGLLGSYLRPENDWAESEE